MEQIIPPMNIPAFDFKDWIDVNGLQDIEHIFVKHKLTKLSNLCTQSTEFASFICDPILLQTQQHLISTAVKSIQTLSITTTEKQPQYIIITEKEQNALKLLQSHLQVLKSNESFINEMYNKYITNIDNTKTKKAVSIENTQHKIKTFFDKLNTEIALKQQLLLKQLDAISPENIGENDNKESETWLESKTLILKQTEKLNEAINAINKIIHSTKENTQERQEQIMNIFDNANSEFKQIQIILDSNNGLLQNYTQENNLYDFDVNLKLDKHEENILNIIQNIEIITEINDTNENGTNENENEGINYKPVSSDEDIMKKQEKEISNLKSQNECYFTKISELQKTIYALQTQASNYNYYVPDYGNRQRNKKKEKSKKPMVGYCKTKRNGDTLWNATVYFIGEQETAAGNSKKNARHNCIRKFEARYKLNDNELDTLWNVL
eukprot:527706_1